ncbi:MAG: UDP-N-acetylmuramoyl-L-alanine--D-glutamate ligase [Candidatus Staskawiczbacteria bacterium]|nr:UDP-N-acetylmuramoyl-L-alanine--D-glutamate ligase [Candidatus Staskawiczbacteria bacterium]
MTQKATNFEFTSYKFEPSKRSVVFNYKTEFEDNDPLFFTENIILPESKNSNPISEKLLEKILSSLHIIIGISYYKLYYATKVSHPYNFSKDESKFWNTIYKKGLGEFLYKNKLDPKNSPSFSFNINAKPVNYKINNKNKRFLVGIGGGKDSIVSAELLKNNGQDITGLYVKTGKGSEIIDSVIEKIDINQLKIERHLDWQIHQEHLYKGHIPVSAIYAFLGIFLSVIYDYSGLIVSNEHSSNFGNINYKGLNINHQWSKSFEFENLFQNYVKEFISPDLTYFSLLRLFYEIRIVKIFSQMKKYFPYFSSCNNNFKVNSVSQSLWCKNCPKCVFAFTMLSAFLTKNELVKIFGRNLYQDKSLLPLFKDILGLGEMKPFDCVGTFEESQEAMKLAEKKFKNHFIIKTLSKKIKSHPETLLVQNESHIPEDLKFLGMENALILGYGKEGKVTERYLKKFYRDLKVSIADEKKDKNYLKNQPNFDILIKTPGIRKEEVKINYTTASNIFFSKVKGKNTIIGVTGSKGKSTTSSLIFKILKQDGKNVELLGNIGKPMLERLLTPVSKDTIFVLELSSYQLDDIKFSPDIAVLTSLFEEHMDFHGNKKNYYKAKKNIINFQGKDNFFVYNPKSKDSLKWLSDYNGKDIAFDSNLIFKTKLLGEHNKENIRASISVAKILNVSDKSIVKAIENFNGLPHRLELIGKFKGVSFYDDAISTTPESTIKAIESLKNVNTIFLGGQDRGYNFSNLEKTIKKYKIKNIVLFPDSGSKIIKNKKYFNIFETKSMQEAVKFAYKNTVQGDICLLSCASPSYSIWKNFEEKGDQFKKFVLKYSK